MSVPARSFNGRRAPKKNLTGNRKWLRETIGLLPHRTWPKKNLRCFYNLLQGDPERVSDFSVNGNSYDVSPVNPFYVSGLLRSVTRNELEKICGAIRTARERRVERILLTKVRREVKAMLEV